jgi:hypothetical protein
MSRKEWNRLPIMANVKHQKLILVQAAILIVAGYRQCKRICRRYQADGDDGLWMRKSANATLVPASAQSAPPGFGQFVRSK